MKTILTNGLLSATILHKGAELCSLKSASKEYIWDGNPEIWGKHSPVLFPIVGALQHDEYVFENQKYHLSRHGFARDCDFEKVETKENYVCFKLSSNDATFQVYPFHFEFFVGYTLIDHCLKITFTIHNSNNFAMPFSVGAHPAFALPGGFEAYHLEFEQQEILQCFKLENSLISDESYAIGLEKKVLPLTFDRFKNDALVLKKLKSKSIILKKDDHPILSISFDDFPNLGLWSKPNADFICIEPWCGYADIVGSHGNFLSKEGLLILAPYQAITKEYLITIL